MVSGLELLMLFCWSLQVKIAAIDTVREEEVTKVKKEKAV
jgi:hypothetical protein